MNSVDGASHSAVCGANRTRQAEANLVAGHPSLNPTQK